MVPHLVGGAGAINEGISYCWPKKNITAVGRSFNPSPRLFTSIAPHLFPAFFSTSVPHLCRPLLSPMSLLFRCFSSLSPTFAPHLYSPPLAPACVPHLCSPLLFSNVARSSVFSLLFPTVVPYFVGGAGAIKEGVSYCYLFGDILRVEIGSLLLFFLFLIRKKILNRTVSR